MASDVQSLQSLKLAISEAETEGNRVCLARKLSPELASLRANGTVDNAERNPQQCRQESNVQNGLRGNKDYQGVAPSLTARW